MLISASCVRHDVLPDAWHLNGAIDQYGCFPIDGVYQDQATEQTSDCYSLREDPPFICTTSLSRSLLGTHVIKDPTHVQIERKNAHELSIRLFSDGTFDQEATLSSEKDEFECVDEGIRVHWRNDLIIAPPFVSRFRYLYGTFRRATDGALIMKRNDNTGFFAWGFIPWGEFFESQWVRWPPYKVGQVLKKGTRTLDKIPNPNVPVTQDQPSAESDLQMYYNDPSHSDAKKWLCRAADLGNPEAQYRLALLYENGSEGLTKDSVRAYMWYRISESTGGYMRPSDQAERLLVTMTPEQAGQAEQLVHNWRPGECERRVLPDSTPNRGL